MMRVNLFGRKQAPDTEALEDVLSGITDEASVPEFEPPAIVSARATKYQAAFTVNAVTLAEQSVIGAVLADNRIFDQVIDILKPNDFLDVSNRAAFKVIADIIGGKVLGTTIAEPMTVAVQPGIESLVSMTTLTEWVRQANTDAGVVGGRIQIVRNAAAARELDAAVNQAQSILAEDGSIESKSDEILKLLSGASEIRSLPVKSLGSAAIDALTQLAERARDGESNMGVPTGFQDLDALTAGWHGGQLIVIAARPGVGKTAFAMSSGLASSNAGVHVLAASMEMKATELSKRAIAIVSGVDSHAIRIGALTEPDWEKVVEAGETLSRLPFNIVDLPSVNISALSGLCRRLHRDGKLGLLIVDYLQIMEVNSANKGNREQQIAELSRGFKKLAMQLDIPVIVLSQLNRSAEKRLNKRPQLSDLRESGSIEQDADVVIFIHRDDVADKNGLGQSVADIIVEKQRAGAPGEIQVRFDKCTTGFSDFNRLSVADPLGFLP